MPGCAFRCNEVLQSRHTFFAAETRNSAHHSGLARALSLRLRDGMTSDAAKLATPTGTARLEFLEVNPFEERDRIVEFFWDQRYWPGDTIEEYYAMWDWRYTSLSDGDPVVFVARVRESGKIVGHIAAYPRRFRVGDHEVRGAVLGNLVLDLEYRAMMVGPRLLAYPATLVKRDLFDLVVAFANDSAHAGFVRAGFQDLGFMHLFIDPRRTTPLLRRRLPWLGPLAAIPGKLIDSAFAARRALHSKTSKSARGRFKIVCLSPEQFESYSTDHWVNTDGYVASDDGSEFVVRRFLKCPYFPRRLFGVIDANGLLQGYVIAEGDIRLKVWDCQVNQRELSGAAAIRLVADSLDDLELLIVPTLPGSDLAAELRGDGLIERPPFDFIERTTPLAAYWSRESPLANTLADPTRWRLWFGSNHY
jgi:hypothetical protein